MAQDGYYRFDSVSGRWCCSYSVSESINGTTTKQSINYTKIMHAEESALLFLNQLTIILAYQIL